MPYADYNDLFLRQRIALAPFASDLSNADMRRLLREVVALNPSTFADFLNNHGLSSLWHHLVVRQDASGEAGPHFLNVLKQARLSEAGLYLAQKSAIQELDVLFSSQDIAYAAIKGAPVRELVYSDPALRQANDIDILVSPNQREAAARALVRAGFRLHADPDNISHEATFTRGTVAIDLHWHILRPGRTRAEMTQALLKRRQRLNEFWGLDDSDTIFLMLVHPAVNKYVCNMASVNVVDFVLWLRKRPVDWDKVAHRLTNAGLKTAAWTVLTWIHMLLRSENTLVPSALMNEIRPTPVRSRYLTYWLQHNLVERWCRTPLMIQVCFTLLLHDRPSDSGHAISGWMRARRTQSSDPLLQME